MSLTLSDATAAGQLAAQITATTSIVGGIKAAIANGLTVSKAFGTNPANGNEVLLFSGPLDAEGSASILAELLTVFEAQLTTLDAQLAAIGQA
jgi:hypothetical protein